MVINIPGQKIQMPKNHAKVFDNNELKKEAIRIYKNDRGIAIRDFLSYKTTTQDTMLLISEEGQLVVNTSLVSAGLSITEEVTFFHESESYLWDSLHVVFKGRLHFFGSWLDRIRVCGLCDLIS